MDKSPLCIKPQTVIGVLIGNVSCPEVILSGRPYFPVVRRWVAQDDCWWSRSCESNKGLAYKKQLKGKFKRVTKKCHSKTRVQEVCTKNHCYQLKLAPQLPSHPPSGFGLLNSTERSDCCSSGN